MTNKDFINGWDAGVLQKAVDNCHFNSYVSFNLTRFCVFSLSEYLIPSFLWLINRPNAESNRIFLTWTRLSNVTSGSISLSIKKAKSFSPFIFFFLINILISATGRLLRLSSTNPVQTESEPAIFYTDNNPSRFIAPVYAYTGTSPTATSQIVIGPINFVAVLTFSSTPTPLAAAMAPM